ncbi:MAG TPA: hypothetical protein VFQ44_25635 [Streptosporangiaceae bacterium]|nr:hypothetical protein [Streptosporangiaceae bacterium]
MTAYVPPGWPAGVHPPGSEEFERSAIAWLLDVVPADYLLHGVLQRHPIALATLARHHLSACVDGARDGYRTARTELGPHLPPGVIEAVLTAYRNEGRRLAAAAQAADLIDRALHGEVFVRQASGGARSVPGPGARRRPGSPNTATQPRTPPAPSGEHES